MACYRIPYRDRFGQHEATKWGDTPAEALAHLKKARDIPGVGATDYDTPRLEHPQPFSDEMRELRASRAAAVI